MTRFKNDSLESLDKLGWKEWNDPKFAVSYLFGLASKEVIISPDDKEVLAALICTSGRRAASMSGLGRSSHA